jgi:hypothetical protein
VPARSFGCLCHPDAAAALGWPAAVGFEAVRRQDGEDGPVQHAEVRLGDAVVEEALCSGPARPGWADRRAVSPVCRRRG